MAKKKVNNLKKNDEIVANLNNYPGLVTKYLGIDSEDVLKEVIVKAAMGMPMGMQAEAVQIVGKSALEMEPKDPVEAKLCAKEATLYSLAMTYLQRAESNRHAEEVGQRLWFETDIQLALKLLEIHNKTVDVLHRYRRQGEQRVIVQHVQVNGGQAIVGHVETGGGGL